MKHPIYDGSAPSAPDPSGLGAPSARSGAAGVEPSSGGGLRLILILKKKIGPADLYNVGIARSEIFPSVS